MRIHLHAALAAAALYLTAVPAFAEPITVQQAIDKAVAAAPSLDADRAAIDAARAARLQAGLKPNDSITVETENFVGTGYYSVLEQAEITASYN
ncbi:MAG: TolC family protein, partial [Sphingomonadales bacterium]